MSTPTRRLAKPAFDDVVLFAAIALILGGILPFFDRSTLEDEIAHVPQIMRFYAGDFTLVPDLTTIPGYHAFLALVATALGSDSLPVLRAVNLGIAIAGIGVYALLLREVHGRVPADRLIQLSFFPIICPYDFLVYTDVAALGLVATALLLALRGRHAAATLVGVASMLVRQNDVVWLVMLPVLAHVRRHGAAWDRRSLADLAATGWVYALGAALFAGFVYWNGGVALGDRASHPAFTFHLGNVYFFLLLYGLFFLPSIVARLPVLAATLSERRAPLLIGAAALALYLMGFKTDHPYNNFAPEHFLRNRILMTLAARPVLKVAAFVPIGLAILHLLAEAERRREIAVVCLFTVLGLVPAWLVEQRYYMIPFALLLLFRRDESRRVEAVTSACYAVTALIFVYGIQNDYFFL